MYKLIGLLSITLALGSGGAVAQTTDSASKRSGSSPDAASSSARTPDSKSSNAEDRKLLAAVRKAVVDDKSLSRSAHNIKMTTNGGVVSLRGTVPSEDEKKKIEQVAQKVSGVSSVENNLEVRAQTTSRGAGTSGSTAGTGTGSMGSTGSTSGTSGSSSSGSSGSGSGSSTKSN